MPSMSSFHSQSLLVCQAETRTCDRHPELRFDPKSITRIIRAKGSPTVRFVLVEKWGSDGFVDLEFVQASDMRVLLGKVDRLVEVQVEWIERYTTQSCHRLREPCWPYFRGRSVIEELFATNVSRQRWELSTKDRKTAWRLVTI